MFPLQLLLRITCWYRAIITRHWWLFHWVVWFIHSRVLDLHVLQVFKDHHMNELLWWSIFAFKVTDPSMLSSINHHLLIMISMILILKWSSTLLDFDDRLNVSWLKRCFLILKDPFKFLYFFKQEFNTLFRINPSMLLQYSHISEESSSNTSLINVIIVDHVMHFERELDLLQKVWPNICSRRLMMKRDFQECVKKDSLHAWVDEDTVKENSMIW
mgnify:CR=1 FL=1